MKRYEKLNVLHILSYLFTVYDEIKIDNTTFSRVNQSTSGFYVKYNQNTFTV